MSRIHLTYIPSIVFAVALIFAASALGSPQVLAQEPPDEGTTWEDSTPSDRASETLEDADSEEADAAEEPADTDAEQDETEPADTDQAKDAEEQVVKPATEPADSRPWDVSRPCENYQHPYEADLCQQWRTAEAAQKTAAAAERNVRLSRLLFLVGGLATLLLLLAFIPLIMAALAARRAARGSGSAPAVGGGANQDEIRAFVDIDKLEFIETPKSEGVVKVKITYRNTGQTPAYKVKSAAEVGVRDIADEDMLPVMPLPDRAKNSPRPRLGRDAIAVDIVKCSSPSSLADRVINGDATILVWGFAEYIDVFDRRRKTAFQYLCNAETLDTGQIFKPMIRGDEDS